MKKINFNFKFNLKIGIFTFTSLFFLYLLYLSIPSLYDSGRVQKDLYNKLIKEFGLNLSLSSNVSYRILPRPHFHIKDSKIFINKKTVNDEIGEIKDVKIFISQKNLFNSKNLEINKIVLSKGNFFFNRKNFFFITELLEKPFSKKKIFVKKSKLFFNDKKDSIVFIYTIDDLNFFTNKKKNSQIFKTKGSIFKVPVKFNWTKNLNTKNIVSSFKADKIDIDFINKGIYSNELYTYENTLNILSNNLKTDVKISKNQVELKSKKSLIKNTPISYKGNIELTPFSFNILVDSKEIDFEYFFKNASFLNEIVSSNILLNDNINGIIKIKTQKLNKNKVFNIANININFEEGNFNFNNSYIINEKFAKLRLINTNFESVDTFSNLNGEIILKIFDHNQLYKLFPIPKEKRFKRKFEKIKYYFTLNLNNSKFLIDKINFLDKNDKIIQSKKVDDFVEDNYETHFSYSNSVLFKNFMKKVLNIYLGEG